MLGHTKKHLIEKENNVILMKHAGVVYQFPKKIAEKYRVDTSEKKIKMADLFKDINDKYTRPGALLQGIRIRENITQIRMAKKLKVTQSDISQMENGTRKIGRTMAKRIEKLFGINYRSLLE